MFIEERDVDRSRLRPRKGYEELKVLKIAQRSDEQYTIFKDLSMHLVCRVPMRNGLHLKAETVYA